MCTMVCLLIAVLIPALGITREPDDSLSGERIHRAYSTLYIAQNDEKPEQAPPEKKEETPVPEAPPSEEPSPQQEQPPVKREAPILPKDAVAPMTGSEQVRPEAVPSPGQVISPKSTVVPPQKSGAAAAGETAPARESTPRKEPPGEMPPLPGPKMILATEKPIGAGLQIADTEAEASTPQSTVNATAPESDTPVPPDAVQQPAPDGAEASPAQTVPTQTVPAPTVPGTPVTALPGVPVPSVPGISLPSSSAPAAPDTTVRASASPVPATAEPSTQASATPSPSKTPAQGPAPVAAPSPAPVPKGPLKLLEELSLLNVPTGNLRTFKIINDNEYNLRGVVYGEELGYIHILEANGEGNFREVWKSPPLSDPVRGIFVEDLDGDGKIEVVAYTSGGNFFIYGYDDHDLKYRTPEGMYERITCMQVANMDDSPELELFFIGMKSGEDDTDSSIPTGSLIQFDAASHFEEWTSQEKYAATDMVIGNVDTDDEYEIVLNTGEILDSRFKDLKWRSTISFGSRLYLIDVDSDGILELVTEYDQSFIRIIDIDERREKW